MNQNYLKQKKILLVDDKQELLDMVVSILKEDGYTHIATAKTAAEGAKSAQKNPPDLAVLDVMLPDGSGFELLKRLKETRDYPVLFLSARGEDEDRLQGLGLGADDYIVKPFLPQELLYRISAILRRSYKEETALLSLADKADTLAGCFGLGNIPTGAADPYALRRAALGIARILLERGYRISVRELFAAALSFYADGIRWKFGREETLEKLDEFFAGRLKNLFLTRGGDTLLVEAALGAGHDDVWAAGQRLAALEEESRKPGFADNARTFKRVANILRKRKGEPCEVWNDALLQEAAEKELASALRGMASRFDELWAADRFTEIMTLMDDVRPTVDAFFDGVMVMAEDETLRENRLNLLHALLARMGRLADFSALQI